MSQWLANHPQGRRFGPRFSLRCHHALWLQERCSWSTGQTESVVMTLDTVIDRSLDMMKVDFTPTHRRPSPARLALASLVSVLGSLGADAFVVVVGQSLFPSTQGYSHFQFRDYSK